jgi:alpha-1,6-mannosyltransferase
VNAMIRCKKLWLIGIVSAAVYAVNFSLGGFLHELGFIDATPDPILFYLAQVLPLSGLYFLAIRISGQGTKNSRQEIFTILLFACLFRVALIPLKPALSSDVYRYLWEGKVQVEAGVNPYVHPPQDRRLAFLRDREVYPKINRKESPAIYPAGAQLLFAAAYRAGVYSPQGFKALALAADALTLVLLLLILKHLGLPLNRILIYAWNPLLIYELFQSGHLEVFVIPLVLGFIYLVLRDRPIGAGIVLGLATAVKLVPVFLLAAVPQKKRLSVGFPIVIVLASTYLFYASAGTRILGFLPTYFSDPYEIFNFGIIQLAMESLTTIFSLPPVWIRLILFGLLFAILAVTAHFFTASREQVIEGSYVVLSAYLLLIYPAFHPWYLCALLPLLCILPSPAWLLFSSLLPLSYVKYLTADGTMPMWATYVQFIPLYALLALEIFTLRTSNERRHQWQPLLHQPFSKSL